MYDPKSGAYLIGDEQFANEGAFRIESNYYIRYNVGKAIFSLDKLVELARTDDPDIDLCHCYTDLLFEACGMLRKRFYTRNGFSSERTQQYKNNAFEYEYDEADYEMLSKADKVRNFIEHIDERDEYLIGEGKFFGTFNVIYDGLDSDVEDGLTDPERLMYNLLDLRSMTYVVLHRDKQGAERITVDLNALGQELRSIKQRADTIWSYLTNPIF